MTHTPPNIKTIIEEFDTRFWDAPKNAGIRTYVWVGLSDTRRAQTYDIKEFLRTSLQTLAQNLIKDIEGRRDLLLEEGEWLDTRLMNGDWDDTKFTEVMASLKIKNITDVSGRIARNVAQAASKDEEIEAIRRVFDLDAPKDTV